jgi:hypothetical protein
MKKKNSGILKVTQDYVTNPLVSDTEAPDPQQNVTDSEHWIFIFFIYINILTLPICSYRSFMQDVRSLVNQTKFDLDTSHMSGEYTKEYKKKIPISFIHFLYFGRSFSHFNHLPSTILHLYMFD